VTFSQAGVPSSAAGFTNSGTTAAPVFNGTISYVTSGGTTTSFWCAIARGEEPTTGTVGSFYCYNNLVAANAYGYLLVLKSPPATVDYTTTYYAAASTYKLSSLDAMSLDAYRVDYLNSFPTTAPKP
jgi:hypothetical protein